VAAITSLRVSEASVVRIFDRQVILQVAVIAFAGDRAKQTAFVTSLASGATPVCTGQGKALVLEALFGPSRRNMTVLAILYPALSEVVRFQGHSKVGLVTSNAIRRERLHRARANPCVTAIATYRGVRAKQRHAGQGVLGNLTFRAPVAFVMALRTIGPQAPLVDIAVATRATACSIVTDRASIVVTTQTLGLFMRAA
jgi:hypothetical protein